MQMVRIHIADDRESARALSALMRRGRVDCHPNNEFIVPSAALDVLRELGIGYREVGRGGPDYAQKALRDSSAAPVQ